MKQFSDEQIFKVSRIEVLDGDTIDADIKLPFKLRLTNERVRIQKINAPERKTKEGSEATEATRKWIEAINPNRLWLECKGERDGKYGRIIGDFLEIENPRTKEYRARLSEYLLENGYATPYTK